MLYLRHARIRPDVSNGIMERGDLLPGGMSAQPSGQLPTSGLPAAKSRHRGRKGVHKVDPIDRAVSIADVRLSTEVVDWRHRADGWH